ncbi:hypothetical protein GCM10009765_82430 [Fodinicola feengrottensis]|uniref:Uncharacterized protein n=1 Tax=Fodinicola feengrottensis TaxID=435914 RepID=A0ABP4VBW6_9ACTN
MRTGRPFQQVVAAAAVGIALLAGMSTPASAAIATRAVPASVSQPAACADPSSALARWWLDFGWPRNGPSNKEWRVQSPAGGKWVWIWGGEDYQNRTNPKLPPGTYNSYDTTFLSTAGQPRLSGRLVRDAYNHTVRYTADHYGSWCAMGVY